jgi:hypothetical protein
MSSLAHPILDEAEAQAAHTALQLGPVIRHRHVLAAGVLRVEAGDRLQKQRDILGAAAERADMIHRECVGEDTAPADPPVGRLQPRDAADRRRAADRAAGIGADRGRHEPRRHRRAGAARRAARQMAGVPRVERRRPRQIPAGAAQREFPGRELAHHDAAGRFQPGDDLGVGGGDMILAQLGMAGGQNALGLDDVLEGIRNTVHRAAAGARHQLALGRLRLGQRRLLGQPQKTVQLLVMRGDAREERLRHLDRRQLPPGIQSMQLGDRQKRDIHRLPSGCLPPFNCNRDARGNARACQP